MNTSTEVLQNRLAKLLSDDGFSNKSAEYYNTPFPLYALLIIYSKANHECYIDYMLGFKLLNIWLSPIVAPTGKVYEYGDILNNYEINEISDILNIPNDMIIHTLIGNVKTESIPK